MNINPGFQNVRFECNLRRYNLGRGTTREQSKKGGAPKGGGGGELIGGLFDAVKAKMGNK